jgi:hypothetical protein
MTSRPAAPESETPLTNAIWDMVWSDDFDGSLPDTLYDHARSLERRLSLTQAEIKGHMRVKDDLEVQIKRLGKDLACAQANFHVTNQAYVKADADRTQAQARVAELEKAAARYRWLQDWYLREGKRSEIDELGHIRQTTALIMDAAIDAALKSRA